MGFFSRLEHFETRLHPQWRLIIEQTSAISSHIFDSFHTRI